MNDYYGRPAVRELRDTTPDLEDELTAIRDVASALDGLDDDARKRIVRYVVDRFDIDVSDITN